MGLDMYLNRVFYVKNWEHEKIKNEFTLKHGKIIIPLDNVSEIHEQVMYWRKANAIHRWFVMNVQDGKDDCGSYEVSAEQLHSLFEVVKKIIEPYQNTVEEVLARMTAKQFDKELAMKELPPQEGFFFGGTEVDEYYYQDLIDTKEGLEKILAQEYPKTLPVSYQYHSSW